MKGQIKEYISVETLLPPVIAFFLNQIAYFGARAIAITWPHYDMTMPLDGKIPLLQWTVAIYFGCYLFWAVNYCLCAVQVENRRNRFFCADALAKGICFVIFLVYPTTNIRPEIDTSGVWGFLMDFLYKIDSADNLFPSIHCLVSWLCWIGVRGRKEIPVAYRWFSLAAAVAVCIATLTTKQHVIVDVIGGVALAEACHLVAGISKVSAVYGAALAKLKNLFRK